MIPRARASSVAEPVASIIPRWTSISRTGYLARPIDLQVLAFSFSLLAAVLYAVFFGWLSIQRYNAFLMHALDMGNMDQAVWNTLHGHPFYFTNMRLPLLKEAWGTTTRLSFHIEPILLPLSLAYLIHAGPQTLIVVQAVIVALGAPAACRLALRVTGSAALAIAATLAYLLSPSLQGATLYEFHPVTLAAPALIWAILYLEERKYTQFTLCALIAISCKEEIGLIVAALSLWHWWRGGSRRLALVTAGISIAWSIVAIGVIVPHFASGPSAYWQRYIDATVNGGKSSAGATALLSLWLHHPEDPFLAIMQEPKLAMLHRYMVSNGYLDVFALPLLLVAIPSMAIILLSTDQHMYGGLGQYSAELVPIGVAASIYGAGWLARYLSRRGIRIGLVTAALAIWLAVAALVNQRVNGFTPLSASYSAPAQSAHAILGERLLQLIPDGAAVSSMDQLNPHLGDRPKSYLFPDVGDADYVALDFTSNVNPGTPTEQYTATMRLLQSKHWEILAGQDGYLILHRVTKPLSAVPHMPPEFFTFAVSPDVSGRAPIATFGPDLELVDVRVQRREQVNLRVPDVLLLTSWRVRRPLPESTQLFEIATNTRNQIVNQYGDRLTTAWLPLSTWKPGQIIQVRSTQISIIVLDSGDVDVRLKVGSVAKSGQVSDFTPRLVLASGKSDYSIVDTTLQVARIHVSF